MRNSFFIFFFCFSFLCYAQEKCGTYEYTKQLELKYSDYKQARIQVNKETKKWIKENKNYIQKTIITIPVVVHVVWNTTQENISDAQIFSQIDVLNADYRRTNIDAINTPSVWSSLAADCEIEFCLATIDPNGSPTTGITRTQTSQTSFSIQTDNVKSSSSGGIDPWPQDDYLNIWVCDLGGGLLGYATPPSNWSNPDDGVVIRYKYFGTTGTVQSPYHKGRTATHEIGHWLNLEHVWGDQNCGNDQVADTPKQEEENYGCPSFPHNANSCNTTNNNGDMFMNYMDYTNDACMNMFTFGQKTRITSAISQYRSNLMNHNLCSGTPPTPSWNCVNGNCIDPGNGNGTYSSYNTCLSQCGCVAITPPITEDFQSGNLSSNWIIENPDGNTTWEITNQAGFNSNSSIYINNADYAANGESDDLILPTLDLTSSINSYLTFDYAYSLWTDPNASQVWSDTLQIYVSNDCGSNWQKIWEKSGVDLTTSSNVFNGFSWTPSSSEWESENIDLSNYSSEDDVVIKFRNINDYENNLFLDNIKITGTPSSLEFPVVNNFVIYPNPTTKEINIPMIGEKTIYNVIGEKITTERSNIINVENLSKGVYFVRIKDLYGVFLKE